jgi:hypothetical protein
MCKTWYKPFIREYLEGEYNSMDTVQDAIDELNEKEENDE